jgi:tetratricopeptide (TPR) repeat protein
MTDTARLEELRRRVQRDPASISFAALAEEYRRLGQFGDAIDTCRAGLLRHPAYVSARVTLGRALIEVGAYDEAAFELEEVLRTAPENLAAIRALADIHRRRGEMEHYDGPMDVPHQPEPSSPPAVPAAIPIAVHSSAVTNESESPALVELEAFLVAIERARRDVTFHAAR